MQDSTQGSPTRHMSARHTSMRDECGLLKEAWYAACLSAELKRARGGAGRPLGRQVLGELLVLWRAADGAPRAMQDRCLHRNALLSEGVVVDGCLACPYHGWMYDQEGRCAQVPSEGPAASSGAPRDARLRTYEAREEGGLVWVWMGDGAPSRAPFEMPRWGARGWRSYYMKTPFANNVTNCVENFMDVPHTVFVHAGWFRSRRQTAVRATVERTRDSVLVTYAQPNDSVGVSRRILNPRGKPMRHTDKFYMPNNTRVDYEFGDEGEVDTAFIITSTCTPVGPMETMVYTLISYKLGWLGWLAGLFLPWYTRQVIEQDVVIMEIQGRSLKHHGAPMFRSTPADALHEHIEELRARAEAGEEPPPPTAEEMTFWV